MNKALQGILATHGIEKTITHLLNLLNICTVAGTPLSGMTTARQGVPNDLEYLNHLIENFPLLDEDGTDLKLNTESPWRIASDRNRLETAADKLMILKTV